MREAPVEISSVRVLCLKLTAARKALAKHKTYEMALEVQISKRELDMAANINRRIMRVVE